MKQKKNTKMIWVAVKADRGLPAEVKAFTHRNDAVRREQNWRKRMNIDYEDTGVFRVSIK